MNEIKLSNIVLDLKKVESAENIYDLVDYKFEDDDLSNNVSIHKEEFEKIDDHYLLIDEWLEYQNYLILRIEHDLIKYLKEIY